MVERNVSTKDSKHISSEEEDEDIRPGSETAFPAPVNREQIAEWSKWLHRHGPPNKYFR